MDDRYGPIIRALGLALLLLAISPATAPFSTCDLIDLFGGAMAPGGPSVQSKASPDEPASEPGGVCRCLEPLVAAFRSSSRGASQAAGSVPLEVPLRI